MSARIDVLAAAAAMDRDDALHLARDLIVRAGRSAGISMAECLPLTAALAGAVREECELNVRWVG